MTTAVEKVVLLESVVPQLEAEGYEVYTRPSKRLLPLFMRDHAPDAIALREDRKLAIQVVREGTEPPESFDKVRERFSEHRDWEYRVYWIRPPQMIPPPGPASRETLEKAVATVEALVTDGSHTPALLMAWSTFEAIGRAFLPEMLVRPQTPGGLVEVMANSGYVTPDEARLLRRLADIQRPLAHGGLEATIDQHDLVGFVTILRTLLSLLPVPS